MVHHILFVELELHAVFFEWGRMEVTEDRSAAVEEAEVRRFVVRKTTENTIDHLGFA